MPFGIPSAFPLTQRNPQQDQQKELQDQLERGPLSLRVRSEEELRALRQSLDERQGRLEVRVRYLEEFVARFPGDSLSQGELSVLRQLQLSWTVERSLVDRELARRSLPPTFPSDRFRPPADRR